MSDPEIPDLMSDRMQEEARALGQHLEKRGLTTLERGALGSYLAAASIGLSFANGEITEATAERMLQNTFATMRQITFGGRDRRN